METELKFLETLATLVLNNIPKQDFIEMIEERKQAIKEQCDIPVVINWVAVSEKLPTRMDEDYLVCVRNKNKEGGIPIQDIGNFSGDGVWIKQNTWEDVVYWAELPNPPCL